MEGTGPKSNLDCLVMPEEKENVAKRSKLDEENELPVPFIQYNGKLLYHTDFCDIALVCDTLLEEANNSQDIMVMGFDMEWPFSFVTGDERTAVIQISPDVNVCHILQISQMRNLPKSMSELLAHSKVRLTGNNIKNDVRKLASDFKGFDVEQLEKNCVDLGDLANSILPIKQRWSLAKLVEHLLDLSIDKNSFVRRSRWDRIPLTDAQQKYAATDAYASLLLYQTLKNIEKESSLDLSQIDPSTPQKEDAPPDTIIN